LQIIKSKNLDSSKSTLIKECIGNKPYIIAEAGINHNGDLKLAVDLVQAAAEAGASAVKFQNYLTEDFIFDKSLKFTYVSQGKRVTESMFDLCKRCEMDPKWMPELKELSDKLGIDFLSTPTNINGINDLIDVGVKMLKNGSDFLNHLPLLKQMSATGLPIIISTGMANKDEVIDAIQAVRSGGTSPIILLHCTSLYPTPLDDINLNRMLALKNTFDVPVGFSDHTHDSKAAIQALSLGACVFEKHFTLDHNSIGPDHWFSLDPDGLKKYVNDILDANTRLGSDKIEPSKGEANSCYEFRLSIRAKHDLKKGSMLSDDDLVFAKPYDGLAPKELPRIIGQILIKDIRRGDSIKWDFIEKK